MTAADTAIARHTEGPWGIERFPDAIEVVGRGQMTAVVAIVGARAGSETAEADAHLIAAAPELKEALIKLKAEVRGILGLDLPGLRALYGNTNLAVLFQRVDEAEAAIAKAEGRS